MLEDIASSRFGFWIVALLMAGFASVTMPEDLRIWNVGLPGAQIVLARNASDWDWPSY
jgi:hypothetical protein